MFHNGNFTAQASSAPSAPPLPPTSSVAKSASTPSSWTPDPVIGHLLNTMRKVGPRPDRNSAAGFGTSELDPEEEFEFLEQLLQSRELNALVKAHNTILFCNQEQCPCVSNSCQIAYEVMEDVRPFALMIEECRELYAILTTPHIRNLMASHDIVAQRDYVPKLQDIPLEVDEDEGTIKMVQLVKSSDPLSDSRSAEPIVGATIKAEESTGRIVIARVMHGGAADRSGLISVGDEVIEVNGINVEGKTPNDVLKILQMAENTITFKLIPNDNKTVVRESRVRLRALFDYEPTEDKNIPCREAGLPFCKGDILHIVSQDDPYWWQARREEDRTMRAGLIPSRALQERRILLERDEMLSKQKQELATAGKSPSGPGLFLCGLNGLPDASSGASHRNGLEDDLPYLPASSSSSSSPAGQLFSKCAQNAMDHPPHSTCLSVKKTKKLMYTLTDADDFDREEVATYEEVARLFPRAGFFRPIVLVGPPGVGRNEIKRRIIAMDADRYRMTIPHTSRSPRPGEVHGKDYFFETREQMQKDIDAGKYIEHGEFKGNLYGTSVDGVRELIEAGLQPVLSPHYQALKKLRTPELKPYIIYIKAPSLERLRETRHRAYARSTFVENGTRAFTDDEFGTMIKAGERMEFWYGHWFDLTVLNDNLAVAFEQTARAIARLDQDAQWVPASWVQ